MKIRAETPKDHKPIRQITQAAFAGAAHSSGTEAGIIGALRTAGALTHSLVAEDPRGIIGHVAFSPVTIAGRNCGWFGLGPVAVRPDCQHEGIGTALVREGLRLLQAQDAQGCVVLGAPEYYQRFGFMHDPALWLDGVPAEYFMRLVLRPPMPTGAVEYHAAFSAG